MEQLDLHTRAADEDKHITPKQIIAQPVAHQTRKAVKALEHVCRRRVEPEAHAAGCAQQHQRVSMRVPLASVITTLLAWCVSCDDISVTSGTNSR